MTDDRALRAAEVAVILGIHRNTLRRMQPEELPYFTVNDRGDRRYAKADVDAFLRRRSVGQPR